MTAVATRIVTILNRYFIKSSGSIVCHIRNGEDKEYLVTLNANGSTGCVEKATGKECQGNRSARKAGHTCYHITDCQAKEAERAAILAERDSLVAEVVLSQAEAYVRENIDPDYEAWKREMGLDVPLTRDAYVACFDPDGLR